MNQSSSIANTNSHHSFSPKKAFFLVSLGLFFFTAIQYFCLFFDLDDIIKFDNIFIMYGMLSIILCSFFFALKQTDKQTAITYPSIVIFIAILALFSGIMPSWTLELNSYGPYLGVFILLTNICCATILLALSVIKTIDNKQSHVAKSVLSNIILSLLMTLAVFIIGPWSSADMNTLGGFAVFLFFKTALMQYGIHKIVLTEHHKTPLKGIVYLFVFMWLILR